MAAGTAAANREDDRRKHETGVPESATADQDSSASGAGENSIGDMATEMAVDEQPLGGDGGVGEEDGGREERRSREEELEEEERSARAELKNRRLYAKDMSAIAMGHPEVANGPGKMMSMGSSSYVVDMVRRGRPLAARVVEVTVAVVLCVGMSSARVWCL